MPDTLKRLILLALLGLSGPWLGGCTYFYFTENPVTNEELFAAQLPRSLAILPFTNRTKVERAPEFARKAFYASLSGLNYRDVELEQVNGAISEIAAERELSPSELPPPLLRSPEIADAVLTGEVTRISKFYIILYAHISVRANIKLYDTRTQQVIYENQAKGVFMDISAPFSIFGALKTAVTSLWHLRDEEIQETFEELAQRVVAEFPRLSPSVEKDGVFIGDVTLRIPNDPMRPGDEMRLEFLGTPNHQAYFDLGSIQQDIPIAEISPGRYGVAYIIQPGQQADFVVVTCKLIGDGSEVSLTQYRQPFKVESGP